MNEEKQETLGEFMRKKREEKNLEIAKICANLKVKIRDIEAIENDKFDDLVHNSYIIRLIRSYAQILQIDLILIEEKIKNLPLVDKDNKKHQLLNIGEEAKLSPNKEMFINFSMISFLVFVVFLVIYNSYEKNSNKIKPKRIIEQVEKAVEEN